MRLDPLAHALRVTGRPTAHKVPPRRAVHRRRQDPSRSGDQQREDQRQRVVGQPAAEHVGLLRLGRHVQVGQPVGVIV
eukprot:351082-Chlamydomonas_euryale.AAC.8